MHLTESRFTFNRTTPSIASPFLPFPRQSDCYYWPARSSKKKLACISFFLSLMRKLRNIFLLSTVCRLLVTLNKPAGFVCVSYISVGSFFPPAGMWIYSQSCDWRHLFSFTHTHTHARTYESRYTMSLYSCRLFGGLSVFTPLFEGNQLSTRRARSYLKQGKEVRWPLTCFFVCSLLISGQQFLLAQLFEQNREKNVFLFFRI